MFNLKKISWHKIALMVIFTVSLVFRLYQINRSVWLQFGYDESRDMLVASHILDNQEHISRGPYAAGGFNKLSNSPIYYYFVALVWFFARTPAVFMYFWAILMSLPVLMGYFIGKKAVDVQTGLILSSLLAVNWKMIAISRELLQPHLLPIFSMGFILSAVLFIKNEKYKLANLLSMIFFIMFPLHFHYGVFIAFPVAFSFIIYCWFFLNRNRKKRSLKNLFIPPVIFLGFLLSWIMMTYKEFPFDQIYFFIFNFQSGGDFLILDQLSNLYFFLNRMVWGNYWLTSYAILSPAIFVISILAIFKYKKNRMEVKISKKIITFLLAMTFSILFLVFYKRNVSETYLLFLLPFFMVLVSFLLRLMTKKLKLFGCFLIIILLLRTAIFSFEDIFYNLPAISYHDQQKEVAKIIFDHHSALALEDTEFIKPELLVVWYTTVGQMPFDGWGTSGIWFYLEKYFDQKLVKNIDFSVNHIPINKYPKIIYIICDHRVNSKSIQENCVDAFINLQSVSRDELELLRGGKSLSVWSVRVDLEKKTPTVNRVNYSLIKNYK